MSIKLINRRAVIATLASASLVVLGLVAAAPANAATPTPSSSPPSAADSALLANAVVVNGVPTFDYLKAIASGATASEATEFATGMSAVGRGRIVDAPASITAISHTERADHKSECGGVTKTTSNWAGHSIYLNSCDAATVAGLASSGGGATAVAGAIFAETGFGIPIAVLGGVIAVFGGWITASNNRNQGVIIHEPYVGLLYVTSQ